jgi:hypothetical protein
VLQLEFILNLYNWD